MTAAQGDASPMRDLIIVGAAGTGRETVDIVRAINDSSPSWNLLGVLDDSPTELQISRLEAQKTPYLGTVDEWLSICSHSNVSFAIAIADVAARRRLAERFEIAGRSPAVLVHPSVTIGSCSSIAEGSILYPGVQVSTNVRMGRYAIVNARAYIAHDVVLEEFVSLNPGSQLSGEVVIENDVLIGAAAIILQGLRVGRGATVGASTLVTRDVPENVMAIGVPGRWQVL